MDSKGYKMKLIIEGQPQEPTLTLSLSSAKYSEQVNLSVRVGTSPSINHLMWINPQGELYLHREAIERVGLTLKNYT